MAGMLPGVESARRRRLSGWCEPSSFNNSGFGSARTTRNSHDAHIKPISFLQRSLVNQTDDDDDKLGGVAREAKERLEGRLRGHLKKEITRQMSQERLSRPNVTMLMKNLQMEVFGMKKNGLKRLSWGRIGLSWKSSKQDECAICLDHYKASEKITLLPCAHRFHSDCLLPWLESNAHCPCCRATVFGSN